MNDLEIFVFKQKPVVDSRDVAEAVGRPHRQLLRSIQTMIGHMKHAKTERKSVLSEKPEISERKSALATNSKFNVSDFFIPSAYTDEQGKERPCYLCTRLGCDMIANKMTGEKGTLFTAAYVTKFRSMEQELARREVQRAIKAPVHRTLTDAIRDSGENERMHGQAFPTYINLIYKAVMGRTAAQMRKDAGLPKGADVVPLLTADELARVTKREAQVTTLLDCGMTYDAIRAVLLGGESHVHTA